MFRYGSALGSRMGGGIARQQAQTKVRGSGKGVVRGEDEQGSKLRQSSDEDPFFSDMVRPVVRGWGGIARQQAQTKFR